MDGMKEDMKWFDTAPKTMQKVARAKMKAGYHLWFTTTTKGGNRIVELQNLEGDIISFIFNKE